MVCGNTNHSKDEVTGNFISVPPWWCKWKKDKQKEGKWPAAPKSFLYERVHQCRDNAPWCAYVLIHESTVAASSLASDDDKKFHFVRCSYQELFPKVTTDAEMVKARELTKKLEQHIDSKTVLQCAFVHDKVTEFEGQINVIMDDLRTKLLQLTTTNDSDKKDYAIQVQDDAIKAMREKCSSHSIEIRKIPPLMVQREVQLNEWTLARFTEEMKGLNFIQMDFPRNRFSIFGRSRPDVAFVKLEQVMREVRAAVLWDEETITGTTEEFKLEAHESNYAQAFANMVRVGNDVLVNTLRHGKLVDVVIIYGLLVSYDKKICTPMKLTLDFKKNSGLILVGNRQPFCETFSNIVLNYL